MKQLVVETELGIKWLGILRNSVGLRLAMRATGWYMVSFGWALQRHRQCLFPLITLWTRFSPQQSSEWQDDVKTGGGKEELCCKLARVFGKFQLETRGSHKGDGMQAEGRKNGPISLEVFGFRKKKTQNFEQKQMLNRLWEELRSLGQSTSRLWWLRTPAQGNEKI